jgi:co-chaperonin GroES (HSP10)
MNKTIIPLGKHVTVRPAPAESRESAAGIITPANEKMKDKCEGTIVAIGDEVTHLKVGDEIIYEQYSNSTEIKFSGSKNEVDLLILHTDDIVGKWSDGKIKKQK